jgi:hypothetical protein
MNGGKNTHDNRRASPRGQRWYGGCPFCPYHDRENRGRRARDDKGKNHRRK